jgi:ribulose 1,5-bisphosphate synthetase/thiazole synthase
MTTSTQAGTMGAYKPRRPGTTYEDSMTSEDIKKMDAQKDEANTQKKTEEAYKTKSMAKGGSASARADGCAQRGKTKGTMVMCGGGMAKR